MFWNSINRDDLADGGHRLSLVQALLIFSLIALLVFLAYEMVYGCDHGIVDPSAIGKYFSGGMDPQTAQARERVIADEQLPLNIPPRYVISIANEGKSKDQLPDGERDQYILAPSSPDKTWTVDEDKQLRKTTKKPVHGKFCVYHEGSCAKRSHGQPGRLFTCNEHVDDNVCINFPNDAILYTCAKNSLVSHYAVAGCASSAFIKEEEIACVDMAEDTYFLLCCTADTDLTPCDPIGSHQFQ